MQNNKPKLEPIHNKELDEVIQDLKQGPAPDKQQKLVEQLKVAKLLAPCDFDVKFNIKNVNETENIHPQQIKFYLLNTNDGKTLFPAFTEIEKTNNMKYGEGVTPKYVVRSIKDFDTLLTQPDAKATGIVINPGLDNIVIPASLVALASGRTKPVSAPKRDIPLNITYGEPSVYPTKMVNAIYDRCEEVEDIKRVWLRGKFVGPKMSFFIVVDTDKKEESVLNEIREVAVPMSKGIDVEVVYYTKELDSAIGEAVALYDNSMEF